MAAIACSHKSQIGCALTALSTCCSCSDRRPLAAAYPVYVDGQGMKMQGKRWARYCWKCRDYWNHDEEIQSRQRSSPLRTTTQTPTWSFPAQSATPNRTSRRRRVPRRLRNNSVEPNEMIEFETEEQPQSATLRGGDGQGPSTARASLPSSHPPVAESQAQPRRQRPPPQNPFGTREEIESEDYQSPISTMFGRAWERFRTQEHNRHQLEAEIHDRLILDAVSARRHIPSDAVNPFQPQPETANPLRAIPSNSDASLPNPTYDHSYLLPEEVRRIQNLAVSIADSVAHSHPPRLPPRIESPPRANPIDTQVSRPPALDPSEMTVSIACRICNEQRCDTLTEPCMHICMCHWCSDIIRSDAAAARRLRLPNGPRMENQWRCPICRRDIVGVRRVYLA